LQNEWNLLRELVRTVRVNLPACPISCKIRIFSEVERTVEYAKMLEEAGCQVLTVHGRQLWQKGPSTGLASWLHIKAVKEAVKIPVCANGNIQYLEDVERCLRETGCDAVMTAEGNLHNPALFEGRQPPHWEMALEYLDLVSQFPCPTTCIRGHLFKLFHFSLYLNADLRLNLAKAKTMEEFRGVAVAMKERAERFHQEYMAERAQFTDEDAGVIACPHWLCQPYVRPAETKKSTDSETVVDSLATIESVGEVRDDGAQRQSNKRRESDESEGLSKNKLRRQLRHAMLRGDAPETKTGRKETYLICFACLNPSGQKCEFKMCKKCCRLKCAQEVSNCKGHSFWFKNISDRAKEQAVESAGHEA